MAEVRDWDEEYRTTPPPWNIGEPQPELIEFARNGGIRSDVLDAGCGYAELSLALAADGYTVVGLDVSPTAIGAATRAAEERGLSNATFRQADITSFSGYDGRFNTVMDSGLFHALPVDKRDGYLQSVLRAAAPGAVYYMLVFATGAFPSESEAGPNVVTEDELRQAVSKYWKINEIRPAHIHANVPQYPGRLDYALDEKGWDKMPAFLLSAHKAS